MNTIDWYLTVYVYENLFRLTWVKTSPQKHSYKNDETKYTPEFKRFYWAFMTNMRYRNILFFFSADYKPGFS